MTHTADDLAILAAVCAAPDDDTPRLVYADWLQEQGEEARAEFIRVQCELERNPECLACQRSGYYLKTIEERRPNLGVCGVGQRPAPCCPAPRWAACLPPCWACSGWNGCGRACA